MDQSFSKAWIRVSELKKEIYILFWQIAGSSSLFIQEQSVWSNCYFASINLSGKGSQNLHVMLSSNRMRRAIHFVLVWAVKWSPDIRLQSFIFCPFQSLTCFYINKRLDWKIIFPPQLQFHHRSRVIQSAKVQFNNSCHPCALKSDEISRNDASWLSKQ